MLITSVLTGVHTNLISCTITLKGKDRNLYSSIKTQKGIMYQKPQLRIPLTWKYMVKEYYSTYLLQDLKGTIHSTVRDSNADIEMDIRTINNCDGYWQT